MLKGLISKAQTICLPISTTAMLGQEADKANVCVTLLKVQERRTKSLQDLIERGVPVRDDKYKWTVADLQSLKEVALKMRTNSENPPRPPTKSILKYIKENAFRGFGPSEDQIRRKLQLLRYFN